MQLNVEKLFFRSLFIQSYFKNNEKVMLIFLISVARDHN